MDEPIDERADHDVVAKTGHLVSAGQSAMVRCRTTAQMANTWSR
jgi:hypothetical protein